MRRSVFIAMVAGSALTLVTSFGLAHHSFAAMFDTQQPFTLVGTVTAVAWRNPHAFIYMDVEDENNNVTAWSMELPSANSLTRSGWGPASLKAGDVVTVEGFRARDGSHTGSPRTVTLNATGETVLRGQSTGGAER